MERTKQLIFSTEVTNALRHLADRPGSNRRHLTPSHLIDIAAHDFHRMINDFPFDVPEMKTAQHKMADKVIGYLRRDEDWLRVKLPDLPREAQALNMLFHWYPFYARGDFSIARMLDRHAFYMRNASIMAKEPRPVLRTFKGKYHLEELTHHNHFIDEAKALGHCIGQMVYVWAMSPVERALMTTYGQLAYHFETMRGHARHLSFGDRDKGPLTTIQLHLKPTPCISMFGPKFQARHSGRERYFFDFIEALIFIGKQYGFVEIAIDQHSISSAVLEAIQDDCLARRHIRLQYPGHLRGAPNHSPLA